VVGILSWRSDRYLWTFVVFITGSYKLFGDTRSRRTSYLPFKDEEKSALFKDPAPTAQ